MAWIYAFSVFYALPAFKKDFLQEPVADWFKIFTD